VQGISLCRVLSKDGIGAATRHAVVVCTENVVRFDLLIESLNVRGDGRANILPLEPRWLEGKDAETESFLRSVSQWPERSRAARSVRVEISGHVARGLLRDSCYRHRRLLVDGTRVNDPGDEVCGRIRLSAHVECEPKSTLS
jgi:hypothetical protein